ncbi:DUF4373 domain-containing protein [Sphingobacterium suaedae]|uniref:DUF4373 domain-containing protein n=1 Tax=Sphingobacterium suaedae TaxID=1686402 RepID=A0ABW5KGH8_9SPHI
MAKESFYFSHDYGSRNDPKIVKVLMKLGQEGKGVYWDLIEMLYEQGGYLMLSDCDSYAFALRTSEECITRLVQEFGLFENDGEKFWSNSVLARMDKRDIKSQKAKESALKRWNKADSNANASQNDTNALRSKSEPNAIKESKGKESKVKEEEIDKEENPSSPAAPNPVFKKVFESMDDVMKSIIENENSLNDIGAVAKIPNPADVPKMIEEFCNYQKAIEKFHTDRSEFKKHFFSWYARKYPNVSSDKNSAGDSPPDRQGLEDTEKIGKWIWLNNGWRDTTTFPEHRKLHYGIK